MFNSNKEIKSAPLDKFIKKIYQEELIFIHVIDAYIHSPYSIIQYFYTDSYYFIISGNNLHLPSSSKLYMSQIFDFLKKSNIRISYVYGEKENVNLFNSLYKNKIEICNNYHVMKLQRENFEKFKHDSPNPLCKVRLCTINDINKLYPLQYEYHLEEVYIGSNRYPKKAEYKFFRKLLIERENFALFLNNQAISKAYINASTKNTVQLGGIYTVPIYRSKGYASYMLNNFISNIFDNNKDINGIQLFVKSDNLAAISLYNKNGFQSKMQTTAIYYK